MKYLLDTNICIYIIKKKPLNVLERFKTHAPGSVGISTITLSELRYGIMKSANIEKNNFALEKFLAPLNIVSFDINAAEEYGKIRAELEKKGTPIGSLDMLIASHAMSLNVTLITNNEREFSRIHGLNIENWI